MRHRNPQDPASFGSRSPASALPCSWPCAVGNGWGDEPGRLGRLFRFGGSSTSGPDRRRLGRPPEGRPARSSTRHQPRGDPHPLPGRGLNSSSDLRNRAVDPGDHRRRPDRDPDRPGPLGRRPAVRHVHASVRRRHRDRQRRRSPRWPRRDQGGPRRARIKATLYRLKGHCGAPSTDFVEQVHMVVYERSLGRLRANAFSFSGNPQGCDHAVRHLQTALDGLQARVEPAHTWTGLDAAFVGKLSRPDTERRPDPVKRRDRTTDALTTRTVISRAKAERAKGRDPTGHSLRVCSFALCPLPFPDFADPTTASGGITPDPKRYNSRVRSIGDPAGCGFIVPADPHRSPLRG